LYADIRSALGSISHEILFVDDGSDDDSWNCAEKLARNNSGVRAISMSRNAGQQEATLYGLSHAVGQYCATMDDDGRHPAGLLPLMFDKLRAEALDIVFAVALPGRLLSKTAWYDSFGAQLFRTLGSALRDRLFSLLFPFSGSVRVSSFRVMTTELAGRVLAERGKFNYFSAMVFQEPIRSATVTYPPLRARRAFQVQCAQACGTVL
jgi:glycosyltransferase involved in cell wall biosynthesis